MFIKLLKISTLAALIVLPANAKPLPDTPRSLAAVERVMPDLMMELAAKGFTLGDPIFLRVIKSASPTDSTPNGGVIEIYLQGGDGKYVFSALP